jgi:hypothetical protein
VRGAKLAAQAADQKDHVSGLLEKLAGNVLWVCNEADHSDRRRRVDRPRGVFIIEADVPDGDRDIERAACFCEAFHRFAKLKKILRVVRVSKVEIIRHRQGDGAGTSEVSRRLGHSELRALTGILATVNPVAIH